MLAVRPLRPYQETIEKSWDVGLAPDASKSNLQPPQYVFGDGCEGVGYVRHGESR